LNWQSSIFEVELINPSPLKKMCNHVFILMFLGWDPAKVISEVHTLLVPLNALKISAGPCQGCHGYLPFCLRLLLPANLSGISSQAHLFVTSLTWKKEGFFLTESRKIE